MQNVLIFDRKGREGARISRFSFWKNQHDIELNAEIIKKPELLDSAIQKARVLIVVAEKVDEIISEKIEELSVLSQKLAIIIISSDASYESVRHFFNLGIHDYLLLPTEEKELEKSLVRLMETLRENWIIQEVRPKIDALVESVILGNGEHGIIIRSLLEHILSLLKNEPSQCRQAVQKTENAIFEALAQHKKWIPKFLFRNEYSLSKQTLDRIVETWTANFSETCAMIEKYRMFDDRRIQRIEDFVMEHVDERLSLDDVAHELFLNASYISHIFKKTTGISFVSFLTEVKMDRAKVLLKDSSIRIGEVALTLGYMNQEYFSRNFKKTTGFTPAFYQKMLEAKSA